MDGQSKVTSLCHRVLPPVVPHGDQPGLCFQQQCRFFHFEDIAGNDNFLRSKQLFVDPMPPICDSNGGIQCPRDLLPGVTRTAFPRIKWKWVIANCCSALTQALTDLYVLVNQFVSCEQNERKG